MQRYRFAAKGPNGYETDGEGDGSIEYLAAAMITILERGGSVTRATWRAPRESSHNAGCLLCREKFQNEQPEPVVDWFNAHNCRRRVCNAEASCTFTVKLDEMEPSPLKDIFLAMQAQDRRQRQIIHRTMSAYMFSRGDDAGSKALTEAAALEMYHRFLQERKARNG